MKQIRFVTIIDITEEGYDEKMQMLGLKVMAGEFASEMLEDGKKRGVTNVVCEWEVKDMEE